MKMDLFEKINKCVLLFSWVYKLDNRPLRSTGVLLILTKNSLINWVYTRLYLRHFKVNGILLKHYGLWALRKSVTLLTLSHWLSLLSKAMRRLRLRTNCPERVFHFMTMNKGPNGLTALSSVNASVRKL
jgi:hypothetical protein